MFKKVLLLLPSKEHTEVLLPWINTLFLVVGGLFALMQFVGEQDAKRVERTLNFVEQYDEDKNGKSLRKIYFKLQELSSQKTEEVAQRNFPNQTEQQRQNIRKAIVSATAKAIDSALEENLILLTAFFTQIALCVRQDACDADSALTYFGNDMFSFLNSYCGYLDAYGQRWKSPFGDEIFLLLYTNDFHQHLPNVGYQKFFCERYRDVEASSWWCRTLFGPDRLLEETARRCFFGEESHLTRRCTASPPACGSGEP